MTHLFKCTRCGNYTLQEMVCPACGAPVVNPNPPRYSPIDKYGKYRRLAKRKAEAADSEGVQKQVG